jgi:dTDP-4-dehydrorhamnose reductase
MKKILIFGVTGMLGNQVLSVFSQINKFKIFATYRNKKDLKILKQNFQNLKKIKFIKFDAESYNYLSLKKIIGNNDIIINNIGIIKPNIDEKSTNSILRAIKVNAIFPNDISKVIKNKSTRLFQIATDCVYDGKVNKYCENSNHNPIDVYGKTKSLGEVNQRNVFNLRVSIIGLETKGYLSLLSWYLKNRNQSINGFKDHKWNGVTTNTFANLLKTIVIKNLNLPNKIHIVPKNIVTKYDLLKLFKLRFKGNGQIRKIKSSNSINRVLKTNFRSINLKIWKLSNYKRILTIKEMINEI